MTLGTTVSMGGVAPNVNREIGQASTQTVSIGDRAVRNLANAAATGAISTSSLQNKGSLIQSGIAAFSSTGIRVYGWIDSGGWGALSATLANSSVADPISIDTRGGLNLIFLVGNPYGIFVYGTLTTTGSAYSATFSRSTTGNFNNSVKDISYIGTNATYGDVYAYTNQNINGLFLVSAIGLIGAPQYWSYTAAPFNFQMNWIETSSATTAYITRSGSTTQKIGIVSGINLTTTPTIAYFSDQGTDTYNALTRGFFTVFAAGTTGLAQAWNVAGTTKYAAPAVQVAGSGLCRVNVASNVVFYANGTPPYVHAWSFTNTAFGTKFANPVTPITDSNLATQIYVHINDKAVCFIISGKPFIYAWDNVTGFGALLTNPTEINALRSVASFFIRSF